MPSRLLTNSNTVRNDLASRNLYTPENSYPLDPTTTTKIVNTISAIASTLTPFRSRDLKNSAIGRLITDKSPITEIGLQCLGIQLAYNTASKLEKDYLPSINLGNVFDNNPNSKLFTSNKDYSLTKNIFGSQTGVIPTVQKVLNIAEGVYPNKNPFPKDITNAELIENTGKAVLDIRDGNLKRNLYQSTFNKTSFNFNEINQKNNKNYKYFDTDYNIFFTDTIISNKNMAFAYQYINDLGEEYGSKKYNTFIFDTTKSNINKYNINTSVNYGNGIADSEFSNDLDTNKNIWLFNKGELNYQWNHNKPNELISNGGLLEYTRNIMIASNSKYISINKKVFDHNNGSFGFNGSAIFDAPSTALPEFRNKRGIRQHTFIDPYQKFSKAIRYIGNKNYNEKGGNENSVIYETVMPRIHPINSKGKEDNKNLMFSIENLAFETKLKEGSNHGIIVNSGLKNDDLIPLSEVGAFGGRVMWFPPYDLGIVETAEAKFTPTMFLGRNEPLYNYESSERSATITFKLLADYPPNLHDFKGKSQKEIIEFFTFGGKTNKLVKKTNKENETPITPSTGNESSNTLILFFQNNEPKNNPSVVNSAISDIIESEYGINGNNESANTMLLSSYSSDVYTYTGMDDKLNKLLNDPNSDIKIQLVGNTSKLYYDTATEKAFNRDLSARRCSAVRKLIDERAKAFGITVTYETSILNGSLKASDDTAYPPNANNETIKEIINSYNSIMSRNVEIIIKKSDKSNKPTTTETTTINTGILTLPEENIYEKTFDKDRSIVSINDDGMSSNYESITEDYFMPVFHSQTPEEYHRRLTFLQQCTRQGPAQRTEHNENNIRNSVFGRQPICILRIGDFFYTKIIINSINFSYKDGMWDMNPEGFGLQPLMCDVTLNIKIIGGQSLKGPIDILQNAIGFNYYANSTFTNKGFYKIASDVQDAQNNLNTENKKGNTAPK